VTEGLANTTTKYDINLNFTQFYCLTLFRITTNEEYFLSPILPSLCLAILLFIALALYSAGTSFKSPCCRFYPLQPLTCSRPRQHNSKCYYVAFPFCWVPRWFYTRKAAKTRSQVWSTWDL